jgi:hypothetical protein
MILLELTTCTWYYSCMHRFMGTMCSSVSSRRRILSCRDRPLTYTDQIRRKSMLCFDWQTADATSLSPSLFGPWDIPAGVMVSLSRAPMCVRRILHLNKYC